MIRKRNKYPVDGEWMSSEDNWKSLKPGEKTWKSTILLFLCATSTLVLDVFGCCVLFTHNEILNENTLIAFALNPSTERIWTCRPHITHSLLLCYTPSTNEMHHWLRLMNQKKPKTSQKDNNTIGKEMKLKRTTLRVSTSTLLRQHEKKFCFKLNYGRSIHSHIQ